MQWKIKNLYTELFLTNIVVTVKSLFNVSFLWSKKINIGNWKYNESAPIFILYSSYYNNMIKTEITIL